MLSKLMYIALGMIISIAIFNPLILEKLLIDVENTVYPLIECHYDSLTNLNDRYGS